MGRRRSKRGASGIFEKKQIDYAVMGREIFDRENPEDFLKRINYK